MAKTAEAKKRMSSGGKLMKFRVRKDCGPHFEPNPKYDPNMVGAEEDNPRDIEYGPGEVVESKRPLDQIFVNKFERLSGFEEEMPNAPGGDVPEDKENDANKDRPVRDYQEANVNAADRFATEEELEGKPELQKLAKGQKPKSKGEEEGDEEGDSEEETEDITNEFAGASEAGMKVMKDDDGKMKVYDEDDLETPMRGSKKGFTTKKEVKEFIKKQMSDSDEEE